MNLFRIKRTHPVLLHCMANHYSQPNGFVGRNICYEVKHNWQSYGCIVGGSSTRFLPGRDIWLEANNLNPSLESIVNNIFFHVNGPYPYRNFVSDVIEVFRETIKEHWKNRYGDAVEAFETLVELPRSGECYKRDGWQVVGQTKGFTCKREGGLSTDNWSGKRVWNTTDLRPKHVLMRVG